MNSIATEFIQVLTELNCYNPVYTSINSVCIEFPP